MLKYAVGLVLVLGCTFIVARHNEYAALQSAQESANNNNLAITAEANKNHPQKNPKNSAWDSPSGHIFRAAFCWPEGVTVWAIILTLMAIAEQTQQTGRSADISERVLVSQFRPKVQVRGVNLRIPGDEQDSDPVCGFELTIVNAGGTDAEVQPFEVTAEWTSGYAPDDPISKKQVAGFSLAAGERRMLLIEPDNPTTFLVGYHLSDGAAKKGYKQTSFPVCRGTIVYLDGNKTERRTGFARAFDFLKARTVPSSDPELEYED